MQLLLEDSYKAKKKSKQMKHKAGKRLYVIFTCNPSGKQIKSLGVGEVFNSETSNCLPGEGNNTQ